MVDNKKKEDFDISSKALLVMQRTFTDFDKTQLEVHKVLTDINLVSIYDYINLSNYTDDAEHAPEAQLEEQWSNKLRPDRHPGSIPGWGALCFD